MKIVFRAMLTVANVFRAILAVAMVAALVAMVVVPVCCYKMLESPIECFVIGSLSGMSLIIIVMEVAYLIGCARENKRKRAERVLAELCMKADEAARAAYKGVVTRSKVEDIEADRNKYQNWWCQTNSELEKAKSEVDKLQNELIVWKQGRFNLYQRLELYKMAQEKVAREIFEEIEDRLLPSNTSGEFRGDSIEWFDYFDLHLAEDIAELKKKYTEGEE